jgi:hypothetical protein
MPDYFVTILKRGQKETRQLGPYFVPSVSDAESEAKKHMVRGERILGVDTVASDDKPTHSRNDEGDD